MSLSAISSLSIDDAEISVVRQAIKAGNMATVKQYVEAHTRILEDTRAQKTLIHFAAEAGQVDIIAYLAESGANVNQADDLGWTAFHYAANENQFKAVGVLLLYGAHPNVVTNQGSTPLHYLVKSQYDEKDIILVLTLIKMMITAGANVNQQSSAGETPLHIACMKKRELFALFLLNNGAKVQTESRAGYTALHYACEVYNKLLVAILLEHKADPLQVGSKGVSPTDIAQKKDNKELLSLLKGQTNCTNLITEKQELLSEFETFYSNLVNNIRPKFENMANLIQSKNLEGLKRALKKESELNFFPFFSWFIKESPLHVAASLGDIESLKSLLSPASYTPASAAVASPSASSMNQVASGLFTRRYTDTRILVNLPNREKNTPLMSAASSGHQETCKYLIAEGASVKIKNDVGNQPLLYALRSSYQSVSSYLSLLDLMIEKGADVNSPNITNNETPVHDVVLKSNALGLLYLMKHGGDINVKNKQNYSSIELAFMMEKTLMAEIMMRTRIGESSASFLLLAERSNRPAILQFVKNFKEDEPSSLYLDVTDILSNYEEEKHSKIQTKATDTKYLKPPELAPFGKSYLQDPRRAKFYVFNRAHQIPVDVWKAKYRRSKPLNWPLPHNWEAHDPLKTKRHKLDEKYAAKPEYYRRKVALQECKKRLLLFVDERDFESSSMEDLPEFTEDDYAQFKKGFNVTFLPSPSYIPIKAVLKLAGNHGLFLKIKDQKQKKTKYHLAEVVEIRRGPKTKEFENICKDNTKLAFSICVDSNVLNFIVSTEQECRLLVSGLIKSISIAKEAYRQVFSLWNLLHSGKREAELQLTLKKIGYKNIPDSLLDERKFEEFLTYARRAKESIEFRQVFERYSSDKKYLTAKEFSNFLSSEQKEKDQWLVSEIMKEYGNHSSEQLDVHSFIAYLESDYNLVQDPNKADIWDDMSKPTSCYFIASSHNTYLEGNQLNSDSSPTRYKQVLKDGCRCVEIDIWDGDDGEPVVLHGHTLTKRTTFEKVIKAIRDYAFVASPFPLVLSFENHCSLRQQDRMGEIVDHYLGPFLPPMFEGNPLPSPAFWAGAILIKGKTKAAVGKPPHLHGGVSKLSQKLSDGVRLKTISFPGFEVAWERTYAHEMCSFSELELQKHSATGMIKHNTMFISRIYPKGTRINSDNFNPYLGFTVGAQLVALNYQTNEPEMFLNYGFFRSNGNSGFLLKPPGMTDPNSKLDPFNIGVPDAHSKVKKITITVINTSLKPENYGSNLVVNFSLFGIPEDTVEEPKRVLLNFDEQPNSISHEVPIEFPLKMSSMATLLLLVNENNIYKGRVAYWSMPVETIRAGYRVVPLLTNEHQHFGNLICHFELSDEYPAVTDTLKSLHASAKIGDIESATKLLLFDKKQLNLKDATGKTALHIAIESGNLEMAKLLLRSKPDLKVEDTSFFPPLHLAAELGNFEMIKLLIEYGADPKSLSSAGYSTLHYAIRSSTETPNEYLDLLNLLVSKGADVNYMTPKGETPLILAVVKRKELGILFLLNRDKPVDLKVLNKHGFTAVEVAIMQNSDSMVKILWKFGALQDPSTLTRAIELAQKHNLYDALTVLQEFKKGSVVFDPNQYDSWKSFMQWKQGQVGNTVDLTSDYNNLVAAVNTSNYDVVKRYVKDESKHEIFMMKSANGQTVLHHACAEGNSEITELLINLNELDLNMRDLNGWTPLHHAAHFCHTGCCLLLVKNDADPMSLTNDKSTPLHMLARSSGKVMEYLHLLDLMMTKGAVIDALNERNESPLHIAALNGNELAVYFFVSFGASTAIATSEGKTPLQLATEKKHENIYILLGDKRISASHAVSSTHLFYKWFRERAQTNYFFDLCVEGNLKEVQTLLSQRNIYTVKEDVQGRSGLHLSVMNGHNELSKYLLTQGAFADKKDILGNSPLMYALLKGHLSIILELLAHPKTDHQVVDLEGNNAIHLVILYSNFNPDNNFLFLSVLQTLVNKGLSVNAKNQAGLTPLHIAVQTNKVMAVLFLINSQALLDEKQPKTNYTPLHMAVAQQNAGIIRILLEAGANTKITSINGTALELAEKCSMETGQQTISKILDQHQGSVRFLEAPKKYYSQDILYYNDWLKKSNKGGYQFTATELQTAVKSNDVAKVKQYLSAGGSYDDLLFPSFFPLHTSCTQGNTDMVELFLSSGAIADARDQAEFTPLHLAVQSGFSQICRHLVRANASCQAVNKQLNTPLHYAIRANLSSTAEYLSLLDILMSGGADVNIQNQFGETPLMLAAIAGKEIGLLYLLKHNADPNIANSNGYAPLHLAVMKRKVLMVECLIRNGADLKLLPPEGSFEALAKGYKMILAVLESGNEPPTSDYLSMLKEVNNRMASLLEVSAKKEEPLKQTGSLPKKDSQKLTSSDPSLAMPMSLISAVTAAESSTPTGSPATEKKKKTSLFSSFLK